MKNLKFALVVIRKDQHLVTRWLRGSRLDGNEPTKLYTCGGGNFLWRFLQLLAVLDEFCA